MILSIQVLMTNDCYTSFIGKWEICIRVYANPPSVDFYEVLDSMS